MDDGRSFLERVKAAAPHLVRPAGFAALAVLVVVYGIWVTRWQRKYEDMFCLDFHKVYAATVRMDRGENPYAAAAKFPEALWAGTPVGAADQSETLAYPPLVPVLARPLGTLEWDTAARLWSWLNIALLAGAVWLASKAADPNSFWLPVPLAVLVLALWNLRLELQFGNTEVVLLFCYSAAARALRAGRPALAGAAIGLAAAIKVVPAFLLLPLALGPARRAALVGAAVAIGLTLAAAAALGPGTLPAFATAYSFKLHPAFLAMPFNQSACGWLLREGAGLAWAAVWTATILTVHFAVEARRRTEPGLTGFGWSVATLLMVLPFVFYDYSTELLLPLAIIMVRLRGLPRVGAAVTAMALAGALYLIGLRSSDWGAEGEWDPLLPDWLNSLSQNRVFLGNAVIWGLLLVLRLREPPERTERNGGAESTPDKQFVR